MKVQFKELVLQRSTCLLILCAYCQIRSDPLKFSNSNSDFKTQALWSIADLHLSIFEVLQWKSRLGIFSQIYVILLILLEILIIIFNYLEICKAIIVFRLLFVRLSAMPLFFTYLWNSLATAIVLGLDINQNSFIFRYKISQQRLQ